MARSAKDIVVKPINREAANEGVKRWHYSGSFVRNSQLHFGVFLDGKLEGVMQFGPSMDKEKVSSLVSGTRWNGFLELNRMAFSERLPRNSESRAIAYALRTIRKTYPHIEWVISFADGTQCGDGTIYRASGFVLTGIKKNKQILVMPDGSIASNMTMTKGKHILASGGKASMPQGAKHLSGFQLRYVYFLNPATKQRLTVPVIPFEQIAKLGAEMYKGKAIKRASSKDSVVPCDQQGEGGVSPTDALQSQENQVPHANP